MKSARVRCPSRAILDRAIPVALLLAGIAWFWHYLGSFACLPGTDAYYYALQAQSILDSGHLKVPGNGVLYYAIALIAWFGVSIDAAFRIVLTAVFMLVLAALWYHATRMRSELQPFALALTGIAAPVMAFHAIEFPRLTLGLAVIPILLSLAAEERALRNPLLWLTLAASSLLHPLVAVLGGLLVGGILLTAGWSRYRVGGRAASGKFVLVAAPAVAFAILMSVVWPGLGLRLASMSAGSPGLPAVLAAAGLPVDLKLSVLLMWALLAVLAVYHAVHGRGRFRYLPLAVSGLALWPNAGTSFVGMGGRLALATVFIAIPVLLIILDEGGRRGDRPPPWFARVLPKSAVLAALLLLVFPLRVGGYHELLSANDYDQYAKVVAFLQTRNIPMLIAHRGLDFYYTYRLKRDAFHFDPEPDWDPHGIWRVSLRVTPEELVFYAPAACLWGDTAMQIRGTSLLLVREDCWERFRAAISSYQNPDLYQQVWQDAENPSRQRPAFLRKKYQHVAAASGQM